MKTEQAIEILKQYNIWRRGDENMRQPNPTEIGIAINVVVEQFASQDKWISVDERLPKDREKVLVYIALNNKSIIRSGHLVLESKYGHYWQSGQATQLKVTHWQPLPPPPKTK